MATVRYVALGGYNGACECQIEPKEGDASPYVKFNNGDGVPIVFDLKSLNMPSGEQFRLHSEVGDQHTHSDYYVYEEDGGMMYGGIKDGQGHFTTLTILGG